jgi:hypothetical protein
MDVSFEGLEDVEHFLRQRWSELAYVTLLERLSRREERRIGRLDLPAPDPEASYAEEDPAEAAIAWLTEQLRMNSRGMGQSIYRVRCYFPKGHSSATFTVQVNAVDDNEPVIQPESEDVVDRLEVAGRQTLAEQQTAFVAQMLEQTQAFRDLVLGTVGTLEGHHQRRTDQYAHELTAARGQINDLAKSISSQRIAHATANADRIAAVARIEAEEQRQQSSQALAQQAVGQIGQLVSLVAMQKAGLNLSPSQQALLGAVQSSPELQAALAKPEIQALLADPANLEALAAMLTAAASNPNNNPEDEA